LQSIFFSGKNEVELASAGIKEEETQQDIREDDTDGLIIRKTEVSHQPEDDGMKFLLLRDGDEEHDESREKGTDDDTCQQEGIGVDLSLLPSKIENSEDGQEGPNEGGQRKTK
jgi:hypothetical protein